jgi:ribosome-binding factor A
LAKQLRRDRVAEQIHHEISDIIQQQVRDPRLGWVTVTRVEMSSDLSVAKVFVSVFGKDADPETSISVLTRASRYVRMELGHRVRLRLTPEVHFKLDRSMEHSQRIMDLLRETDIPPETDEA